MDLSDILGDFILFLFDFDMISYPRKISKNIRFNLDWIG